MAYHVEIEHQAARAMVRLRRSDRSMADRIDQAIEGLKANPRPDGSIKLTGMDAWRVRVGTYRVIYTINDTVMVVSVKRVGHRRESYRRL
ncbi:MAG: type II toxin-antitoxin system RelE family toxin [Streptosporangiales bacterium]